GAVLFGAVKHHVFEKVGEAGRSGMLVAGADAVKNIERDVRNAVVALYEDLHPVLERFCFNRKLLGFVLGIDAACRTKREQKDRYNKETAIGSHEHTLRVTFPF